MSDYHHFGWHMANEVETIWFFPTTNEQTANKPFYRYGEILQIIHIWTSIDVTIIVQCIETEEERNSLDQGSPQYFLVNV